MFNILKRGKKLRTLVHIGQHKTGTTSIQHYLKDNRLNLIKDGLYVPNSICGYDNPSHFILNVYSLNKNRYSSMKELLLETKNQEYFFNLKKCLEKDISRHYQQAISKGCKDVVWTNEGLYLLNSTDEYNRLVELFSGYSSEVVCVCCFREVEAYRKSYIQQQQGVGKINSEDKDSYRYLNADSWLFDYERKKKILREAFAKVISLPYNSRDMIKPFMETVGYSASNHESIRLNVTPKNDFE